MIKASVGTGGKNRTADVKTIQRLLNKFAERLQIQPLVVDGDCGPKTQGAILAFQQSVVGMGVGDGRVDPRGPTWKRLAAAPGKPPAATPRPPAGPLAALLASGPLTPLTPADFAAAATRLGCEEAAIRAVAKVESSRKPFDELGRPTILYERHLFHRLTSGRFARFGDLSHPEWGGYGPFAAQYKKLERAYALDADAALKSCSWGMFQILGENHREAGFASVADFVRAMCRTEADHLNAFVSFIEAHPRMHDALRARDWTEFARRYNGPAYHRNHYDERIADAYRGFGGR